MDLVSVIVPIYNVEKYLKRCINSIQNQSYKNIEIILVDDGSTDSSGQIADHYSEMDKRISVIHKDNGGLSDARNKGIDIAKGEYICFIDSDDYIHEKMIEVMYQILKKNACELAVCENYDVYVDEAQNDDKLNDIPKIIVENPIEAMKMWYKASFKNPTVAWNKLYNKKLFDTLRFEKGRIHEDEIIMQDIFCKCSKIVYIYEKLYYYYHRDNSITGSNSKYNLKNLDAVYAVKKRLEFFQQFDDQELKVLHSQQYADIVMFNYVRAMQSNIEKKNEVLEKLLEDLKIISNMIGMMDFKHRLKIVMFKLSPRLYGRIDLIQKKIRGINCNRK